MFEVYPHWKYCLGTLYVFDYNTGLWTTSKAVQRDIVQQHTEDLRIISVSETGAYLSKHSYGSTLSKIDIVIELIKGECFDDEWLIRKENSSLGMLLFNNGAYDKP